MKKQLNETEAKLLWIETEMVKKEVGKSIKFKNQSIQNTVNKMVVKFRDTHTYDDVISMASEHAVKTVLGFEIRDGKDFNDLLAGDKEIVGKLNKNINLVLKNRLQHLDDTVMHTFENASKRHVAIKPVTESLDTTFNNEEDGEILSETIDKGFWEVQQGYEKSFFIKWFLENKDSFLTKKQSEFISSVVNGADLKRDSYMERIKERAFKEFKNEFGIEVEDKKVTYLERQIQRKLGLWNGLLNIVEDDSDLEAQNTKISNWLVNHMNRSDEVSDLVSDNLTGKEYRRVMYAMTCADLGVEIPSKVLYKLVNAVYKRVEMLNNIDTTCKPFYKKESEMGRWTPEAHKEYKEKLLKANQQDTYVYDAQGNFKEAVPYKPFKTSKTIIKMLTPTGVTLDVNGEME